MKVYGRGYVADKHWRLAQSHYDELTERLKSLGFMDENGCIRHWDGRKFDEACAGQKHDAMWMSECKCWRERKDE